MVKANASSKEKPQASKSLDKPAVKTLTKTAEQEKQRMELHAAIIFGVGLFLLVSFIYYSGKSIDQEMIGLVGTQLVKIMNRLFGEAALVLPVLLLIWSFHIFYYRQYWSTRMTGFILFYLAILTYYSIYDTVGGLSVWETARNGLGGGYIGGAFNVVFHKLFGDLGAKLLLVLFSLASLVLIINKPLMELLSLMSKGLKQFIQILDKMIFYQEPLQKDDQPDSGTEPVIVNGLASKAPVEEQVLPGIEEDIPDEKPKPPRTRKGVIQSGNYQHPALELLTLSDSDRGFSRRDIKESIKVLEDTFANFGIKIKVTQVSCGPAVTRYELQPAPGVKVSKIISLTDDLQLSLAARGIRIEAPIPGKSAIGIEVPNDKISRVGLRTLLSSSVFQDSPYPLTVALGEDVSGTPVIANLADMPHLLIAGATGSGKSVCLNAIIVSLLYKSSPDELRLVLIDPKRVELTVYNGIPHLLCPVVTDPKKAAMVLRWMIMEMEKRYQRFSQEGVRDIYRYNEVCENRLPFILIIIDELADLMNVAPVEVEDSICRLAQMARAAGIHLVVATQRPSVDVVTGIIKANIPSRIAFAVSAQSDSRTILDSGGAEKLLGRGDMLFFPVGAPKPIRVQGAYVSDAEIESVVNFIKEQAGGGEQQDMQEWENELDVETMEFDDELFWDAAQVFVDAEKASVSLLQRKLRIGYARAARLVDLLEERGIISAADNNKKREVLINREQLDKLRNRGQNAILN